MALAEGNALYAEQLASFAAEGGEGLPPTLEAVLAGRLGRLDDAERAVLQHAAIVGREFCGLPSPRSRTSLWTLRFRHCRVAASSIPPRPQNSPTTATASITSCSAIPPTEA